MTLSNWNNGKNIGQQSIFYELTKSVKCAAYKLLDSGSVFLYVIQYTNTLKWNTDHDVEM